MKCKQPHPGFKLVLPHLFPMMLSFTTQMHTLSFDSVCICVVMDTIIGNGRMLMLTESLVQETVIGSMLNFETSLLFHCTVSFDMSMFQCNVSFVFHMELNTFQQLRL